MFDGGGNNRLYVLWWVIAIGLVMWFALRATLGFAPGMPEEQAEPWPKAAKSAPSPGPGGEPREPSARAAHQPAGPAGSRPQQRGTPGSPWAGSHRRVGGRPPRGGSG